MTTGTLDGTTSPHTVPTPSDRTLSVYDGYENGPHDFGRLSAAVKRVSWGAILAGAVVAVVVGFLLNLLGLGVGFTTFDPASSDDTAGGLGIAQGIWTVVSALLSLFAGGWVAGRLAGMPRTTDGAIHGVVTWAVTTLLGLYLLTTGVGSVVSGVTSLLGSGLSAAGQGVAAVAPEAARAVGLGDVDLSTIRAEADQILRQTGDPDLAPDALADDAREVRDGALEDAADADLQGAITRAFGRAGEIASAADRQDLVNVLVARTDLSEAEARQSVARWEDQAARLRRTASDAVQTIREDAPAVAGDVTDALGIAALVGFFALLLGAVAAGAGGMMGSPENLPLEAVHPDTA